MPNVGLILQLCALLMLLAIAAALLWKRLYRRFPLFLAYVFCVAAVGIVRIFLSRGDPRIYFYFFWSTEALYAILGLLAIYEAFNAMFRPLYAIWWFRGLFVVLGVVPLAIALIEILRKPPVQLDQMGIAILVFEIAVRYVQVGFFALAFIMIRLYHVPPKRYATGIIDGFGIAALGILAASLLRSEFGTKFNIFFSFAPPVAYIIALLIWLTSLWGAENGDGDLPTPDIPLVDMPAQLRRDLELAKKARKRKWM